MDWKNSFDTIKNKVKYQLHARGLDDIEGIVKFFSVSKSKSQEFDVDASGGLNKIEFERFTSKIGMFLTTQ